MVPKDVGQDHSNQDDVKKNLPVNGEEYDKQDSKPKLSSSELTDSVFG